MSVSKSNFFLSLALLTIVCSIYRIIPARPFGFAPQIAMALFSGFLFVKDKKWAFLMPLVSMLLSDLIYQGLFLVHATPIQGFYGWGQVENYLLFAALACLGFTININKPLSIVANCFTAPTLYFVVSNSLVWVEGGGWSRPKSMGGYLQCMVDGLPFYRNSVLATITFSIVFFGLYYGYAYKQLTKAKA